MPAWATVLTNAYLIPGVFALCAVSYPASQSECFTAEYTLSWPKRGHAR